MTRAAQALGESASAVSRRIDRLERETGRLLFHRTTRAVRLTDDGAGYLATANQVLELLDQASAQTEQGMERLSGTIRIWSSPGFGLNCLPALVARLCAMHPGIRPEVELRDGQPNFAMGIDVAIVPAIRPMRDSALVRRPIMGWSNVFVASPDYLARHPAPKTPARLRDHLVILGGEQARDRIELSLASPDGVQERLVLHPTTVSSDINFVRQCCLAGGGIAYMPAFMVEDDLRAGQLEPVLGDFRSDSYAGALYCLYRRTRIIPPKIGAFLSVLPR